MSEGTMVLESARSRLSKLAPVAAKLNDASDAFTKELETVEAELNKLNSGVDVELEDALTTGRLQEDRDESDDRLLERYTFETFLAYGKYRRQEWRILVREYRVDLDAEVDEHGLRTHRYVFLREKPLLESSRELRIAAASQMDTLLKVITREAAAKAAQLREVIDKK